MVYYYPHAHPPIRPRSLRTFRHLILPSQLFKLCPFGRHAAAAAEAATAAPFTTAAAAGCYFSLPYNYKPVCCLAADGLQ